jgi:hypothetical protein
MLILMEMTVTTFNSFPEAIDYALDQMRLRSLLVHRGKWQGIDVSRKPDAATHELHHFTMKVPMVLKELGFYRREIKPNLPWADNHFEERVDGNPLNPGKEWRNWPWGASADKSRIDPLSVGDPGPERIFDHTYAMRYWPKYAGMYSGGILPEDGVLTPPSHRGIYFPYGDLDDVVLELKEDPTTRQAILPVFFPEDTGYQPGRRKPCSLFYHFMLTGNSLDISYQLRSCDLAHHMRDDIYLTVRLLLWALDQLRLMDPAQWTGVLPGVFVLQIANLHMFRNDYIQLTKEHGVSDEN